MNAYRCLFMPRDDYECLGTAADITTVIELTHFFYL